LQRQGDTATAVQLIRDVLTRNPMMHGVRPLFAICLARHGEIEEARKQLTKEVEACADADFDIAYWLSFAHAVLGEREEALKWLRRSIELGNDNRQWIESDANWGTLKDDPQFIEIMASIGT
jgi:Flp pilus assembly protein TadD